VSDPTNITEVDRFDSPWPITAISPDFLQDGQKLEMPMDSGKVDFWNFGISAIAFRMSLDADGQNLPTELPGASSVAANRSEVSTRHWIDR
jgi:hypothetical protein